MAGLRHRLRSVVRRGSRSPGSWERFSRRFLFAKLLQQTPDSGLILNEDEIDPLNGAISFSILPPFDSNTVSIQLPAMLESRRPHAHTATAKTSGAAQWVFVVLRQHSQSYRSVVYESRADAANPGASEESDDSDRRRATHRFHRVARRSGSGARYRPAALGSARHRRLSAGRRGSASSIFDRDLGYAEGDEPYAIQYQIQAMQLLISPLGYTVATQASTQAGTKPGASQYVDLRVQKAAKKYSRSSGCRIRIQTGPRYQCPRECCSCPL